MSTKLPSRVARATFLEFAVALAKKAARAILSAQSRGFKSNLKPDGSYVTSVDVEVEQMLRTAIGRRFPGHAIEGEELPASAGAEYTWILDPIDGTDNFVHGIPTYGTLIGLYHRDRPLVGVIAHPALRLHYAAARGLGAFANGLPLRIVDRRDNGAPIVITTAPENFVKSGDFARFCAIQQRFPNSRIYRDCFAHSRVVSGGAGAMVDANVRLWDIAATRAVVEEAGGRFVELKRWTDAGGVDYYTCVFGRRQLVDTLCDLMTH